MNYRKTLTICSLLLTLCTFAQLEKNTWLVGGNGSINSYNRDYAFIDQFGTNSLIRYKSQLYEMSPKIGYFFFNKFAGGLKISLVHEKSDSTTIMGNSGGGSTNTFYYAVGFYARYYLLDKEKLFNIVIESEYQKGNKQLDSGITSNFNQLNLSAGPTVFFNSSVAMEFLLGYKRTESRLNDSSQANLLDNGFQALIGFQVHLKK